MPFQDESVRSTSSICALSSDPCTRTKLVGSPTGTFYARLCLAWRRCSPVNLMRPPHFSRRTCQSPLSTLGLMPCTTSRRTHTGNSKDRWPPCNSADEQMWLRPENYIRFHPVFWRCFSARLVDLGAQTQARQTLAKTGLGTRLKSGHGDTPLTRLADEDIEMTSGS